MASSMCFKLHGARCLRSFAVSATPQYSNNIAPQQQDSNTTRWQQALLQPPPVPLLQSQGQPAALPT